MEFELRQLEATDLFPVCTLVDKIGFREIKQFMTGDTIGQMITSAQEENTNLAAVVGVNFAFEVVQVIIKNLPKCQTELFDFLSSVSGIDASKLSFVELTELIVAVVQKEEFKDFFKVVAKLFK